MWSGRLPGERSRRYAGDSEDRPKPLVTRLQQVVPNASPLLTDQLPNPGPSERGNLGSGLRDRYSAGGGYRACGVFQETSTLHGNRIDWDGPSSKGLVGRFSAYHGLASEADSTLIISTKYRSSGSCPSNTISAGGTDCDLRFPAMTGHPFAIHS
jgi:hypothetical protein